MNPYEMEYLQTMAKMNDKQKEDFKEAKEWLDKNWQKYTSDDFLDVYEFVESADDKREIYRNDTVHIMYADEYTYFEILLNEGKEE